MSSNGEIFEAVREVLRFATLRNVVNLQFVTKVRAEVV